jgi:hypothetical protein
MKSKELIKEFTQLGLTPEKVLEIVRRYERQKEKVKKYQKEVYEKVSISIRKENVDMIMSKYGIDKNVAKKLLAVKKLIKQLPEELIKEEIFIGQ